MKKAPLPLEELRARATAEIAAHARVDPSKVAPDAHLILDLGLSSLDVLNVLAYVEEAFGARFPDELLGTLTTLRDIEEAARTYCIHTGEGSPS